MNRGYVLAYKGMDFYYACNPETDKPALKRDFRAPGVVRFRTENYALCYRADLIRLNPTLSGPHDLEPVSVEELERAEWEASFIGRVFLFFARLAKRTRSS